MNDVENLEVGTSEMNPAPNEAETKTREENVESSTCAICLNSIENVNDETTTTRRCEGAGRHAYHASCLEKWAIVRPTCPICKQSLGGELERLHATRTNRTDILEARNTVAFYDRCLAVMVNAHWRLRRDHAIPSILREIELDDLSESIAVASSFRVLALNHLRRLQSENARSVHTDEDNVE